MRILASGYLNIAVKKIRVAHGVRYEQNMFFLRIKTYEKKGDFKGNVE